MEKSCGPKAVWLAWPLSIHSAKVTGRTGVRGVFTVFLAKLGSHCRWLCDWHLFVFASDVIPLLFFNNYVVVTVLGARSYNFRSRSSSCDHGTILGVLLLYRPFQCYRQEKKTFNVDFINFSLIMCSRAVMICKQRILQSNLANSNSEGIENLFELVRVRTSRGSFDWRYSALCQN